MSLYGYTEAMEATKVRLGRIIRAARKSRGLRQEDVAQQLDVNVKQVGRWESGENAPGGVLLSRLIQFFRDKSDQADLDALRAIVDEEVALALAEDQAESPLLSGDEEHEIAQIIARLRAHPMQLARWIGYGKALADDVDDRS